MFGLVSLGTAIVNGFSNYFLEKQKIKKAKTEAELKIINARAEAEEKRLMKESEQDFDLNRLAIQNMQKSWKDEFVLLIVSAPAIMLFIPELQPFAITGFSTMQSSMPLWYQILLISIYFSIYGLRDILKLVLQLILTKKGVGQCTNLEKNQKKD